MSSFASSLGLALVGLVVGCGTPNPKVLDATESARQVSTQPQSSGPTESDKIRSLIASVRTSEATFVQDGIDHAGPEAAAELERRLAKVPAGVSTATQFIDLVGSGRVSNKEGDIVRLSDGDEVSARDWLLARLAELEGKPVPAAGGPSERIKGPEASGDVELGILDALLIVEHSRSKFIAPGRRSSKGEVKGKPKEYTGPEFASMLRKKWEFLGADIHDLDAFIDEIATDAFASMEPYRVVHSDGSDEEFKAWLLEELEARKKSIAAQGGAG